MKQEIKLSDLPTAVQEKLEAAAGIIPQKWSIYAQIILLIQYLSVSDAKWVIKKLRYDLRYQLSPPPPEDNHKSNISTRGTK